MRPGQYALTVMRYFWNSIAAVKVEFSAFSTAGGNTPELWTSPRIANFEALYMDAWGFAVGVLRVLRRGRPYFAHLVDPTVTTRLGFVVNASSRGHNSVIKTNK